MLYLTEKLEISTLPERVTRLIFSIRNQITVEDVLKSNETKRDHYEPQQNDKEACGTCLYNKLLYHTIMLYCIIL